VLLMPLAVSIAIAIMTGCQLIAVFVKMICNCYSSRCALGNAAVTACC